MIILFGFFTIQAEIPSCTIKKCPAAQIKTHHPQYRQLQRCLQAIQTHGAACRDTKRERYSLTPGSLGFDQLVHVLQKLHFLPQCLPQGQGIAVNSVQLALKKAQSIYRLPETGVLDEKTTACLNGNQTRLIQQIKKAMAQWRHIGLLPPHCLVTNIPSFDQELIYHGKTKKHSRVMVGTPRSKTPTFSGFIDAIVFNPTWIVPPKRYKEFKPYLGTDGYYLKNGALLQKPGPKNHLGQVKFLTKRKDAIIFHSTHEPECFAHSMRAYSLGCIRIQDFKSMASAMLSSSGVAINIHPILKKNISKEFRLSTPFPVYVVYQTLWIKDGVLQVYPDIYGRWAKKITAVPAKK